MLLYDISTWEVWHYVAYTVGVLVGFEILTFLVNNLGSTIEGRISPGGKALEHLTRKDWAFIMFNRLTAVVFTYHVLHYTARCEHVYWGWDQVTVLNTVVSYVALHLVYDFFYSLFHRFLHIPAIYPLVHKHHHRQVVPSRGNIDAVNVHPFEFLTGEYIHLVSIYLIPSHIATVAVFIIVGGILASLNHTRFDARFDGVFQVKYHDLHHRIPTVNYGQYIMFWDKIFGSFQPYSKVEAEKAG